MLQFTNFRQKHFLDALKLSFSDLKRISIELAELSKAAQEDEIKYYEGIHTVPQGASEGERQQIEKALSTEKDTVKKYAHLALIIEDTNGEQRTIVFDKDLDQDFDKIRFPTKILKLTFDNTWNYNAVVKKFYFHQVVVVLDFSDVGVFDFQFHNKELSCFVEVKGLTETVVLGTIEKIKKSFEPNSLRWAGFLHKHLKYELLLCTIGIPAILFLLWKSRVGELLFWDFPSGLQLVGYLFLSILALIIFRIFYNYTKWLFPYLEIKEQPKTLQLVQRGIVGVIGAIILKYWGTALVELASKYLIHSK